MALDPTQPNPQSPRNTRNQAEAALALRLSNPDAQGSEPASTQALLHDLQVHQIELELQNEELRLAKNTLDAAHARYADLYDLAPVGYCGVNADGILVHANLTLAAVLGVARAGLVQRTAFSHFVVREDQETWYRLHMRSLPSDAPQTCELRLRRNLDTACAGDDGGSVWVQLVARSAPGEAGAQTLHIAVTDINARKTAEKALHTSEELFCLFLQHTPVHTFFKEVSRTESRVLRASDSFQQMIGAAGHDMQGKTMAELFPPDLAAKITADDWIVVSRGESVTVEEELNGRSYTSVKFPIASGGKTLLAGFTLDVTERKRAQDLLLQQNAELTFFNTAAIDRELVMIGLKQEVNALAQQLGQPAPYDVDFVNTEAVDPS